MHSASLIYVSLRAVALVQQPSAPTCQLAFPKILEPIKAPIENFLCNYPFLIRPYYVIYVLGVVIFFIAAFLANIQRITDFLRQKRLIPSRPVISDSEILLLRKSFLRRLRKEISKRQSNSLHELVKIDLQIEEQLQQVGRSKFELISEDRREAPIGDIMNRVLKLFKDQGASTTQLNPTQKIVEVFDRNDIQGKLLILGEPGSGKTTELLTLAQDSLQRAVENDNAPIPIIFDLAKWKANISISDWLVVQLFDVYKIDRTVGQKWVERQQLIPLLDSLDEIEDGDTPLSKCIEAINQFLKDHFQADLVVCCRRERYEQSDEKLDQLNGAVYLKPLTNNQIQQYLQGLNRSSLWKSIQGQAEMLELVRTPLFLTILVVAYQGRAIENSQDLLDVYIRKQLKDPKHKETYPPGKGPSQEQTLYYLVWLAKKLEVERESEFLIERMQPTWLESSEKKHLYRVGVGLIVGMFVLLSTGLVYGAVTGGISLGISSGFLGKVSGWVIRDLADFLSWMLIFGLVCGLMLGLSDSVMSIEPVENVRWSPKISLPGGMHFFVPLLWFILGLIFSLWNGLGLFFGLSSGLFLSLLSMLGAGIKVSKIVEKSFPNQGIRTSIKNALLVGLFSSLFFGLLGCLLFGSFGLIALFTVPVFSFFTGMMEVIQHFVLRLILYINGYVPWNYARFLEHSSNHRFVQIVGGRYRFMHDKIRKHFVGMSLNLTEIHEFLK